MALATVFVCCGSAAPEPFFSIHLKGAIGRAEVRYFLKGAFGGYGGFVRQADSDGAYRIPLFMDRQTEQPGNSGAPADSLRAIVYSPGCQFELLSVELKPSSSRTADFGCRPLATTTFRGWIMSRSTDAGPLDVEIFYVAGWDHAFFGLADGAVQQFKVATAPLNAAGRFQVKIPDFSKDAVTVQMRDAYLNVLVVAHSSGNLLERVLPSGELRHQNVGLKIQPRYDSELSFSAR